MNLYQAHIMDHYRNPHNRGALANPDFSSDMHNPSCGDTVMMQGRVQDGVVTQVAFEGKGCVVSQAAASLLTQAMTGKTMNEAFAIDDSSMLALVGIPLGPMRMKCALLSLHALHAGLATLQSAR